MQDKPRFWQSVVVMLIVVIGLMTAGTGSIVQADSQERSKVIPRDANAYGNSYGQWSAQWTQWWLSIPAATNPATDTTGANCGESQSGPVWFLAGTFGGPAAVIRHCNVPAGKALFFPLENGVFGAGVGDCEPTAPGVVCNLATLRMAAAASMDALTLEASLDGKPLDDLHGQRVQSPVLTLTYPPGNVVGVAQGTYAPNVVDGYWLMLAPLRDGGHTLHFKAKVTGGVFAGTVIEVTYHLTVAP